MIFICDLAVNLHLVSLVANWCKCLSPKFCPPPSTLTLLRRPWMQIEYTNLGSFEFIAFVDDKLKDECLGLLALFGASV